MFSVSVFRGVVVSAATPLFFRIYLILVEGYLGKGSIDCRAVEDPSFRSQFGAGYQTGFDCCPCCSPWEAVLPQKLREAHILLL